MKHILITLVALSTAISILIDKPLGAIALNTFALVWLVYDFLNAPRR